MTPAFGQRPRLRRPRLRPNVPQGAIPPADARINAFRAIQGMARPMGGLTSQLGMVPNATTNLQLGTRLRSLTRGIPSEGLLGQFSGLPFDPTQGGEQSGMTTRWNGGS